LTGEWTLVSPHRTKRPWQGKVETADSAGGKPYEPDCYLCPGNTRASGDKNPDYKGVHVFTNDYSALLPEVPHGSTNEMELIKAESEKGLCKVVCFSPRHDLTIPRMKLSDVEEVVRIWKFEYLLVGKLQGISHVQIFENRGEIMGCSNPHPHGQIWASQSVPLLPRTETLRQADYLKENRACLLCDYLALELKKNERVVVENSSFAAVVPFWAVWPFEVMVLPKRHMASLADLDINEIAGLADIMRQLGIRYDNLFRTSFPYSMGIHQSPTDQDHPEWHFHLHYFPPLLRSSTVRKFMVGYEMLCEPQRDITPESAAARLREMPSRHYLD
jgi:UDPglucose--hexose-1-phosphate uridylyltransferase